MIPADDLTFEQTMILRNAEFNNIDLGDGQLNYKERLPGSIQPFMEDPQEQMLKNIYSRVERIEQVLSEYTIINNKDFDQFKHLKGKFKEECDLFANKITSLSDEVTKLKEENVNLKNKIFFLEEEKRTSIIIPAVPVKSIKRKAGRPKR